MSAADEWHRNRPHTDGATAQTSSSARADNTGAPSDVVAPPALGDATAMHRGSPSVSLGGSLQSPLLRDVELLNPHEWNDRDAQIHATRRASDAQAPERQGVASEAAESSAGYNFSYEAPVPRLAPRDAGATVGAGAEAEEELQTNPAVAAMGAPADTDDLIPSPDILAPPLSQPQQDQLYSFSIEDYKQHLSDLLRLRVLAAILFWSCLLVSIFFSQGNWLVVLACLYLMFSSIAGIRGSFRAEKRMVDIYYLALLIFMGIYAVAFLIYMLVDGVAPTAKNRCAVSSFVTAYGSDCTSTTAAAQRCFDRCVWEMKINLLIETLIVAALVAALILFLTWDSARVSASLQLWSHHPLLEEWHSELVVFEKYGQLAQTRADYLAEEAEEQAALLTPRQQARALRREQREQRRRDGEDVSEEEEEEEEEEAEEAAAAAAASNASKGRTFGSGAVGTATTTSRRKGPLTQLYREQQQEKQSEEAALRLKKP